MAWLKLNKVTMLTITKNETGLTCFTAGTYRCGKCTMIEREVGDCATFPVCAFCHDSVQWILVQPRR
jgi:hypothetical protein